MLRLTQTFWALIPCTALTESFGVLFEVVLGDGMTACFTLLYQGVPTNLNWVVTVQCLNWALEMAKCPNCGKEVFNPDKSFKNALFHVEAYTCPECKSHFHVSH
jgi:hypothetical protein